jgi:hypothetical protein
MSPVLSMERGGWGELGEYAKSGVFGILRNLFVSFGVVACTDSSPQRDAGLRDLPSREDVEVLVEPPLPDGVSEVCPTGCAALDGPCMRGVCTTFGCKQERLTGPTCDDGLDCTSDDRCELGMCRGGVSTCQPGVACGEVFCPGADAKCVEGHCTYCSKVLTDADCDGERYPRLVCPNMPAGVTVVARLGGRVPTTGWVDHFRLALSWGEASPGRIGTPWCEVSEDHMHGWPDGCGMVIDSETRNFEPRLWLRRLNFVVGEVAVLVSQAAGANPKADGPLCDAILLGSAVLSIQVEP